MIPKKIHYCWFGRSPLPADAVKCINSWKTFLPDYKIIEWNEDNFDVHMLPYTKDAYEAKKYAFVSDYARVHILHEHGGIYFDTDVEVVKNMDTIIAKGSYMGIECMTQQYGLMVNPGLGFGAEAGHPILSDILDVYKNLSFWEKDKTINMYAIVRITSDVLKKHGLKPENSYQNVAGISIYPAEYFNPLNSITRRLELTENTHSIHWYTHTWGNSCQRFFSRFKCMIRRILSFVRPH